MIPFELAEPRSLGEALALLDPADLSVRPLGGGTALMLMMKSGLFAPKRLVSLAHLEARYGAIAARAEGGLRIGALARLREIERSPEVARAAPSIPRAMRRLSNVRVRNVATLGGNLAHADPHMDLPPLLIALRAEIAIAAPGADGTPVERRIPLADLYRGYLETTLGPRELIVELLLPPPGAWRAAYMKCTTRAADDWPALGVAAALEMEGGIARDVRLVVSAATDRPTRLARAEATLRGKAPSADLLARVGVAAMEEAPVLADAQGSAAYKRALLKVYAVRALERALAGDPPRKAAP
ncbi:MAG TPA: xanthine dehydrogenase family protein subunit M [Alphaproteobacteria bacterium]|nr:xanthine dehydrogenase family protein subunit M [Alphaproteobacteria bacterium]